VIFSDSHFWIKVTLTIANKSIYLGLAVESVTLSAIFGSGGATASCRLANTDCAVIGPALDYDQMTVGWRRLIAGFIVLWAMMDMTVPGVCQSDDLEASLAADHYIGQTITSDAGANVVSSSAPTNSQPDQSSSEDCFCCCSHIAPTGFFHVTVPFPFVGNEAPYSVGAPHDFSSFLYHPPKA
jgi:hypothetical protein